MHTKSNYNNNNFSLLSRLPVCLCLCVFSGSRKKKILKKNSDDIPKIRFFFFISKKDPRVVLPLFPPSRGIPHKTKQNKTKHQRRQNSPALSQLPTLSLSLSLSLSCAHFRGKEKEFKERDAS
jgi:hypothetical protein